MFLLLNASSPLGRPFSKDFTENWVVTVVGKFIVLILLQPAKYDVAFCIFEIMLVLMINVLKERSFNVLLEAVLEVSEILYA